MPRKLSGVHKGVIVGAVLSVGGLLLAGCDGNAANSAVSTSTPQPEGGAASSTPTAKAAPLGSSRALPIPFGQTATIIELGELGGDAWKVTIDQPRDVSAAILERGKALFGEEAEKDESYLLPYRPTEGKIFLGVSGKIQRLIETPRDPATAISVVLVTRDGLTVNSVPKADQSTPELSWLNEMYAPASATFTQVFEVPTGTTGQVLVTEEDSRTRYYFGALASK